MGWLDWLQGKKSGGTVKIIPKTQYSAKPQEENSVRGTTPKTERSVNNDQSAQRSTPPGVSRRKLQESLDKVATSVKAKRSSSLSLLRLHICDASDSSGNFCIVRWAIPYDYADGGLMERMDWKLAEELLGAQLSDIGVTIKKAGTRSKIYEEFAMAWFVQDKSNGVLLPYLES